MTQCCLGVLVARSGKHLLKRTSPVRPLTLLIGGTVSPNSESGLLRLRNNIDAFANIRPCTFYSSSLVATSPLKPDIARGVNIILLRENCGDAYFGEKVEERNFASDSWAYSRAEIERSSRGRGYLAETMGVKTAWDLVSAPMGPPQYGVATRKLCLRVGVCGGKRPRRSLRQSIHTLS